MSDIIKLLTESVANQIAAGEVVQRPASVVKELLENAIDSGATEIKLIIKDAGRTLIQVIDNGCGMSATDARLCFERHATSKISDAKDLFAIRTMGFRGEALASIAAVAQVEMKTKRIEDELGTQIIIEGSECKTQEPCQTPSGTTFIVKNLFYNIPARRNFLKENHIELRHINEEFERVALAFPAIGFSIYVNDKESLHLTTDNTLKQRIVAIFGKNLNDRLITVDQKLEFIHIKGFIGKPEFTRKYRGEQFFYVNNRFIKHANLHYTIMDAYKDLIVERSYPAYFLYFEVDPATIDINIHPTKTEITFQDEHMTKSVVRSTIKYALGKSNVTPTIDFDLDQSFQLPAEYKNKPIVSPQIAVNPDYNPYKNDYSSKKSMTQNWEKLFPSADEISAMAHKQTSAAFISEEETEKKQTSCFGLFNQYIAKETPAGLLLIHFKHATTKLFFERFKIQNELQQSNQCQQLLFPETLEFSMSDATLIHNIIDDIKSIGFDIDHFGGNTFIIRGIPVGSEQQDIQSIFESMLNDFTHNPDNSNKKNKLALALAKSISNKKQFPQTPDAMLVVITELFNCMAPETTPEGFKTFTTLTHDDFEELFN